MPNGSVKYLRVVGRPSKNESGSGEFVGAVTDITELRRVGEMEAALVREQELFARQRAAELAKANEALLECLDALASVPELDEFLGQVMGAITRQLGATSSVLRLRNFEKNVLTLDLVFQDARVMTAAEAEYPDKLQTIPLDEWQLRILNRPATVLQLLDNFAGMPDTYRLYLVGLGVNALLMIPLVVARRLIGSLAFRFIEDREFRPEEIEIARALASQASLAIQLMRSAKTARQSAVLAERNELAGEIHDSLAQFFTGISMQLGAAREVIKAGGDNALSYVERASGAAMPQGNANDIHPAEGFALELFICLLETYHFDAYSFLHQCFGGPARSGVPGISGIHKSDGAFPSQMHRCDIGIAKLWTAVGRRLHLLV
jgi:GAF domain/Histidine kinase